MSNLKAAFDHLVAKGYYPHRCFAALAALNAVHGVDVNPYAAAIARTRLVLKFADMIGCTNLADLPELPIHVVVADSLLVGSCPKGPR
jgi:hypothetical protein